MANNPKANVQIPGYYWDELTCRYYREDPSHPRPVPKVLQRVVESNNSLKTTNLPKNVLDMLKKRELGYGKWNLHSFEDFIIIRNLRHLKCIKELKPNARAPADHSTRVVTFLKGGEHSLFLELSNESGTIYSLKQNQHFFSPSGKFPTFRCFHSCPFSTIDMCEGLKNANMSSIFVVSSDSNTWKMALWESTSTPEASVIEFLKPHISKTPIWCCNKNDFTEQFIFGKQNQIVTCGFHTGNRNHVRIPTQGDVRSIQFDKQGKLTYAGMHTGHLEILDLRAHQMVFRTRLHNRGIDEIVPVFDEKQLICGAFDGMLCNFDLRMRKPLNEYLGHVHSPRKVPFSINEPNNLLCATGLDNITRLWCLGKGGDPIINIHPPEVGPPCRSWLVSDGYKCLLYQYQRSNTYIYGNSNLESLPDSKF